jgi:predicted transcriptional regulator
VSPRGRPIYFDPEAEGVAVFLGPSEAILMEIVWREKTLTVKQALYEWPAEPRPAYTTVQTLLNRLAEHGLLTRSKQGRYFVYETAVPRKEFLADRLRLVTGCLRRNFPQLFKKR